MYTCDASKFLTAKIDAKSQGTGTEMENGDWKPNQLSNNLRRGNVLFTVGSCPIGDALGLCPITLASNDCTRFHHVWNRSHERYD